MFFLNGTMVKVLISIIKNGTISEGSDYYYPLAIYVLVMKGFITNINGINEKLIFALSCTPSLQDKHLVLIKNSLVMATSKKPLTKKQLTLVSDKVNVWTIL